MNKERMTLPGRPLPLGVSVDRNGAQFAILSRHATSVCLELFESTDPESSFEEVLLDSNSNRTGDIWHIWVEGIQEGQLYGYRIDGPYEPSKGHRFNRFKLLLDPCAKAITGNFRWDLSDARGFNQASPREDLSFSEKDSAAGTPKCVVIDDRQQKRERPIKIPLQDTIIYEVHLKGFTRHESSGVEGGGTFKGLIGKIPYLKELGVTAVELMPIHEFDEDENININPLTDERLKNYWGYSTLSFFAPKGNYSSSGKAGAQYYECKEMINTLHREGIEVILDVVFNHTAEQSQLGPTLCFKGIDNSIYYILEKDKRFYKNFSGCGNTFNCNHPIVRDFILDCLKFWVIEMNIDGFRFDLASVLGRDQDGTILSNPPLVERIAEDPILRDTKIIAEAWDAAGAYQVGAFPGRWAEWNGRFRDDVRRFWCGDEDTIGPFATRIAGSSDLYESGRRSPLHSINFITSHDGFTLNDLVSYNEKDNIANGEDNRDGDNYNHSYNHGVEGPTTDGLTEARRKKQIKNFLATLFLSQGVPMLLTGDEFRRTQQGNNNAYCQDNEISWINWKLLEEQRDIFRFTKEMIRFRKDHPVLRRGSFFTGQTKGGYTSPDVMWHGRKIDKPDWRPQCHTLACLINGEYFADGRSHRDADIYIAFNSSDRNRYFEIPETLSGVSWLIAVDTSKPSPLDIPEKGAEKPFARTHYLVRRMSTLVLISGEPAA